MSNLPELHPQVVQPFGAGRDYVLIPADEFAALLAYAQLADHATLEELEQEDALWSATTAKYAHKLDARPIASIKVAC